MAGLELRSPVVLSWSGGKDSALALHALRQAGWEVTALVTTVTGEFDRISMHGVRRELVERQARSLGLALDEVVIPPRASNEQYEAALGAALARYHSEGIDTMAFGDLFLEDVRRYRDRLLARLGFSGLYPIWHRDTRELAHELVALGFRAIAVCVDPRVLDASFAGRWIDERFLADLPAGVDPCGENGEFHTFVADGPGFASSVPVRPGDVVARDSFLFCDLLPEG